MNSELKAKITEFRSFRSQLCLSSCYMKVFQNPYRFERGITINFGIFPRVHACMAEGISNEVDTKKSITMFNSFDNETGMDRLKKMFQTTEFGNSSPELSFINKTIMISFFLGSFIGLTVSSRSAVENVIRKYQSSAFANPHLAKRHLQDNITLILIKNAFKWAWRISLFSGTYSTIVLSSAVYNNKASIWEHIAAGALCGGMWKTKLGVKAAIVGCALGGTLGLICGCTAAAALWITGTSYQELRYWHYDYWEKEYRNKVKMLEERKKEHKSLFGTPENIISKQQ